MLDHFQTSLFIFLLMALSSAVVLYSAMQSRKKIILMAMMVASGGLTYRAFNAFYGQPKIYELSDTDKANLIGFHVDKKNKAIYLWLKTSDADYPFSYRVLYTKKLAKKLRALRRQYRGSPVKIELKGKSNIYRPTGQDTEIQIKDLPQVLNLEK